MLKSLAIVTIVAAGHPGVPCTRGKTIQLVLSALGALLSYSCLIITCSKEFAEFYAFMDYCLTIPLSWSILYHSILMQCSQSTEIGFKMASRKGGVVLESVY